MASSFPGAIDSFTTKVDGVDDVMAAHVNDLQDSVVSVETILQMMMTGWVPEQDTWVYVSATSFKIVGKDVRSKFPTGIKLKCTDGGSTKYFYGISAAMSGSDTLVTITGGSDYSLSGGAITNPYYSYADTPQGFPGWFNHIPPLNLGTAVLSGYNYCAFKISGKKLDFQFQANAKSFSGSTGFLIIGLPVACYASLTHSILTNANDSSSPSYRYLRTDISTNTLTIHKTMDYSTWSATETNVYIGVFGSYRIG